MGLPFIVGIAVVGFAVTLLSTPLLIRSAKRKKILAPDDNKPGRPLVPDLGGFSILAGVIVGISLGVLTMALIDKNFALFAVLLASLASITLLALVGVFDDLFKLTQKTKPFLPIVGALPLIAVTAGNTTMSLPFIGTVDFGLFYTLVLIPLGVTGAANALNMSAGYNGLEAGIGAVASAFLLAIAVMAQATGAAIILAATLGACLAFLYFNWSPARVFPADVGTLTIGGAIAAAVIIGNMEKFGVILLIPAFYELAATVYYSLKKVERRAACHSPTITKDLKLVPKKGSEKYTLFHIILSRKPMTEPSLVKTVLALYAVCGLAALGVYWFGL